MTSRVGENFFKDKNIELKTWEICKDHLDGAWKRIKPEEIVVRQLSGGLSNLVFHCSLPEGRKILGNEPYEVLLRVYGKRPASEIVQDSVLFSLLSEREIGPYLYGIFPGGRLEEYIPSRSMYQTEVNDLNTSLMIAEKVARIHSMKMPLKKDASNQVNNRLRGYLKDIEKINVEQITDPARRKIAKNLFLLDLTSEVEWLINHIERINSFPIVFCHNDLTPGNMLVHHENVDSTKDRIIIIDYEYAAYGYRAFDIANHFCEWMFDYTNEEHPYYYYFPERFPTIESKMAFVYQYLSILDSLQLSELQNNAYLRSETKKKNEETFNQRIMYLCREIDHFVLMSNMVWALWSISTFNSSDIKFEFLDYAETRLKDYFKLKSSLGLNKDARN